MTTPQIISFAVVTALSAYMKNVGALGLFMPVAIRTAQRAGRSPSLYLMPLAFGSLNGTSPNPLISTVRQQVEGRPFTMFDFLPVGLPLSVLAVALLSICNRFLPERRRGGGGTDAPFTIESYVSEARLPADSAFVDKPVAELEALADHELSVIGIIRDGGRRYIPSAHWWMFSDDVLVLQGWESEMAETLAGLGVLPLADRVLALGRPKPRLLSLVIMAVAPALIATRLVTVEVGFFAAAALVVPLRLVSPKGAYGAVEWPIIVMLACLIPVGESLRHTGASQLIAQGLTGMASHVSPTMAIDPFLMAVALGASCDFLTPIGRQNNTLVMGPGGYRFGDYWRLGLPLSCLVVLAGTPLICWVWPLR